MTSTSTDTGSLSLSTGIRVLTPSAREDAVSYELSAALAVAGTICRLGPFWIIYRAVNAVVNGSATRGGLFELTAWAVGFVIAEHVWMATSTYVSHRAAFGTLARLRLRMGDRLSRVPLGFVTRRRSGEIQRTLTDDVERLELFLAHAIPDLVAAAGVVALTSVWPRSFTLIHDLLIVTVVDQLLGGFGLRARRGARGARVGGPVPRSARCVAVVGWSGSGWVQGLQAFPRSDQVGGPLPAGWDFQDPLSGVGD